MQTLINEIKNLQPTVVVLFGTFGISYSTILQTIKHKAQLFENKHKKYFKLALAVGSALGAVGMKLINHTSDQQTFYHFLELAGSSLSAFWIAVGPLYSKKLAPFLDKLKQLEILSQGTGIVAQHGTTISTSNANQSVAAVAFASPGTSNTNQ